MKQLKGRTNETKRKKATKRQISWYVSCYLAAALLGSARTGKGVVKGGNGVIQADEVVIRAGEGHGF